MESINVTGKPVIVDMEREPIKLFRFRIWLDDEGKITYDDDVYTQDVPPELCEAFHRPGEVYSIWAETEGEIDSSSGASGKILMVLSDDEKKMREFMGGVLFALRIEDMFKEV